MQDDVPSPEKDNVPPVRSEPNNSNDQREFHYEINGENQGPISFLKLQELVRQKVVTKETQVWHDGLEDWTPASEIKELAASFPVPKKSPPPLKKSSPPLKMAPSPVTAVPSQTSNDPASPAGFQIQAESPPVPSDVSEFHVREQGERKSSKSPAATIEGRWSSLSLQQKYTGVGGVVLLLFLVGIAVLWLGSSSNPPDRPGSSSGSTSGASLVKAIIKNAPAAVPETENWSLLRQWTQHGDGEQAIFVKGSLEIVVTLRIGDFTDVGSATTVTIVHERNLYSSDGRTFPGSWKQENKYEVTVADGKIVKILYYHDDDNTEKIGYGAPKLQLDPPNFFKELFAGVVSIY